MPQSQEPNLELTARVENTRERRSTRNVQFELDAIVEHFANNLNSINEHFDLVEHLESEQNLQYKDVLRSQIVFLDSAFDFFIHEITKYGMYKIFQGVWPNTEKYQNFTLRLGDITDVLQHTEQEGWFLDIVNDTFAEDTLMSADKVISQLNLIGVDWKSIAERAFYEHGSTTPVVDKFKYSLNSLFKRRNKIAHQSDREHETGQRLDIDRPIVEKHIENIEKIVNSIHEEIKIKNNN